MQIILPKNVKIIIDTLCEHGFEAFAVGGCVRDSLLGRVPGDWDITTSAQPEETKQLFKRTFDTGIEHGTVTVLLDGEGYEVTTYRIDGEYEDSRHPSEVQFTRNLEEDLKRRDFTINAMAYNDEAGIVDIFGGMQDLDQKMIRCVGNAEERFGEDALRILRAVRFAAQLGFEIEEGTQEGIRKLAPTLANISAERIQVELVKMLTSLNPDLIQTAYVLGITKVILPEFDKLMETTLGEHTIEALRQVRNDKVLRLTMLLHHVGEAAAKSILKRLKFDNETLRAVTKLVAFHDEHVLAEMSCVRRAIHKMGEDLFPMYLEVRKADILAQDVLGREEKLAHFEAVCRCYEEVQKNAQCVSLKTLAVKGNDLIAMGMQPGKEIGEMLNKLLDLVLEDPELNQKEILEEKVNALRS